MPSVVYSMETVIWYRDRAGAALVLRQLTEMGASGRRGSLYEKDHASSCRRSFLRHDGLPPKSFSVTIGCTHDTHQTTSDMSCPITYTIHGS